jgi:hypothetical protein
MLGSSPLPWPTINPSERHLVGVNGRDTAAKSSLDGHSPVGNLYELVTVS